MNEIARQPLVCTIYALITYCRVLKMGIEGVKSESCPSSCRKIPEYEIAPGCLLGVMDKLASMTCLNNPITRITLLRGPYCKVLQVVTRYGKC